MTPTPPILAPLTLAALALMLTGPLLQGLGGSAEANAYVFAPIIAVAVLPLGGGRDIRASLRLAGMFLAIGFACLGLWWLGGRLGRIAIPGWLPFALTLAGAGIAILGARRR